MVLLFQNCGQNEPLVVDNSVSGSVSFDFKIQTSSSIAQSCFEVGEVANLKIMTQPAGQKVNYILKRNGTVVKNKEGNAPMDIQEVFISVAQAGDYVVTVEAKDGMRTIAIRNYTFSVKPYGGCSGVTCQFSIANGVSFPFGSPVSYSVSSNPAGLEAYLNKSETGFDRELLGLTPVSTPRVPTVSGTLSRTVEVKTAQGGYVRCSPSTLSIEVGPQPTPPPPTPTPTPPPQGCAGGIVNHCPIPTLGSGQSYSGVACTDGYLGSCAGTCSNGQWINHSNGCVAPTPPPPTPTPPPSGTITSDYSYCSTAAWRGVYECTVNLTWQTYNTSYAQVVYTENGGSEVRFLSCAISSAGHPVTVSASEVYQLGSLYRTFYLMRADSCSPINQINPTDIIQQGVDIYWYDEPDISCVLSGYCSY